jgi:cobalt-zinc-cadmium efflux system membrane fusion protein
MRGAAWIVFALGLGCGQKAVPTPAGSDAPAPSADEAHRDEPEHRELPSRVRLAPKVIAAAGIRLATVDAAVLPQTLDVTGDLAVDPDRAAVVSARAAGRLVDVRFKEGDRVKAGDVLAVLESSELAHARARSTAAIARAGAARKNVDRLTRLAEKGLASGQEVEAAAAETTTLEAEAASARQALTAFGAGTASAGQGARIELLAPIDGFVLRRNAVRGQGLTADAEIATIARFDRAYFLGRLFEKDLPGIREGSKADVRLNAYPKEVFAGTVESVGKEVDPAARTVLARISVADHDDLLKGGLFGSARISMGAHAGDSPRPIVPLSAVTEVTDRTVVFVRQADGDFEVHPVALGRTAGGQAEVVTGVRVGEEVVVDGVFTLKSALLKQTFGEEE